MRAIPMLLLAAALPGLALAADTPKLPRGDDVFTLGMSRKDLEAALRGAGLRVTSSDKDFIMCEARDPLVEYEQYSLLTLPHGDAVLWRVTFGYRLDVERAVFDEMEAALRADLGAPADTVAEDTGNLFDPAPQRRMRWVDNRTMIVLGARWPVEPQPSDRMVVEWSDLKSRRAIGGAANRSRANR